MKIAVEGCAHGELERIYDTIQEIEKAENIKVDLLLCCGDFQATRNLDDLQTMAVPKKYQDICTFYKYYSGEKSAPILTIFIGGNHEASNYLQELPYGGWVAPNIYYMGYAGVVLVNGVRIGGVSGIYKGHDFLRGHHEFAPYNESTKKSVYHVRQLEVYRLKQLSGNIDIFMSHDWPRGIYNYGNKAQLLRFKPHFRDEVEQDRLGSRPCEELMNKLKPSFWFAAHLHCKFAAVVTYDNEDDVLSDDNHADGANNDEYALKESEKITKFLALDKCLPKRRFLQLLDIDCGDYIEEGDIKFEYDLEWLTILYLTNHLINIKKTTHYMPASKSSNNSNGERCNFTPTSDELENVRQKFCGDLRIPLNFVRTVEAYDPNEPQSLNPQQPKAQINPQSQQFCDTLGIDDPLTLAMLINGHELSHSSTLESSDLNDDSSLLPLSEQSISIINSFNSCENASSSSLSLSSSTPLKAVSPTTPSPIKRKSSLLLPQPTAAAATTITLNEDSNIIMDQQPPPAVASSPSATMNASSTEMDLQNSNNAVEDESDEVKTVTNLNESTQQELNSKPPNKKFKRRNQDIYKAEQE